MEIQTFSYTHVKLTEGLFNITKHILKKNLSLRITLMGHLEHTENVRHILVQN